MPLVVCEEGAGHWWWVPPPAGVGTAESPLNRLAQKQAGLGDTDRNLPTIPSPGRPAQGDEVMVGETRTPRRLRLHVVLPAGLRAGASAEVHLVQGHLPCVAEPSLPSEDDALDAGPPKGDLCVPPALATGSAPHSSSWDPVLSYKHLEGA